MQQFCQNNLVNAEAAYADNLTDATTLLNLVPVCFVAYTHIQWHASIKFVKYCVRYRPLTVYVFILNAKQSVCVCETVRHVILCLQSYRRIR